MLIRLLHCFILPRIRLQSSEKKILEAALLKQTQTIQSLDKQVAELARRVLQLKMALFEMHQDVGQTFMKMQCGLQVGSCSNEDLALIMEDLHKHEEYIRKKVCTQA